jgi:hypothetical protein
MSRPSAHRSRFGLAGAAVIALLVLSTGSVAAATGPGTDGRFTQNGKSADASAGDCTSNGDGTTTCSDVGLSVFAGKMSDTLTGVTHLNEVCASLSSYTFDDATGDGVGDPVFEGGCRTDLPTGALRFGTDLTSATLAPTTITIQQIVCVDKLECVPGPSRDVTVAGTWTGSGPISFSKYRFTGDDGTCHYNESSKTYYRDASFLGTVAGLTLDQAYASIWDGKSTFSSRCIEI